ncbi:ABC transporter substrate-binding protein [Paenibacillus aceti]|uniref:ABC transporter substrate-binding protein n=1 Tax=Paenibacillus aceti TaxID=1820010 RepID=A0ABQ1VX03_9BACL|nr:ABC transporter substrate-binding protein [Paenibacillus aceti]GGG03363.1 ABC transporter substrate-binding protein [Paenibacillus aceti]
MKKKVHLLFIVMLCGMLVLTACGKGNSNKPSDSGNTSGNTAESGNQEGNSKLSPYKITMVYPASAAKDLQLVQDEMSKYLTEKINATIELKPIEWASWEDKTNLMKVSNEPFDLMFTASWFSYAKDAAKGQYLELDDLMNEYGKDIPGVLGDDFIKGSRIDGKLYALPTKKEFGQGFGFLLDKKLVDKYGFDTNGIKSIEDMEQMFKTIKENEPDVAPVASSKFTNIWNAANYDYLATDIGIPRDSKELKAVDMLEDPNFIDFYKRMHQWNQNGWFDKDILTSTEEQGVNMIKAGKAFAVGQSLKPGKDKEMSLSAGVEMIQVETFEPFTTTGDAQGAMLGISRTSKDPARAMMFLNMLYTDPVLLNMLDWGIEGKHYVKVSDNVIDFPEGVNSDTQTYPNPGGWMFGNQFNSYLWANEDPNKWEEFQKFNDRSERSIALGFSFNQEPVKSEMASLTNVMKEFEATLRSGAVEPEPLLEKWKAKRKSAGFDKVKAEVDKQLAAWAESQK